MGQKRTAEQRRYQAEQNGYDDDDIDIDDSPVPRNILDYTMGAYEVQLELWFEYKKTHPCAVPNGLKTLKHFAEFIARSIKGELDPEGKPTVQTVRLYFRRFKSGWNRKYSESIITRELSDSVTNYIKGPLKCKLGLSDATRTRTYLTHENFMWLERQLWEGDGHEYVHEAYRVLVSAKLKCHLFTPSRIGEISEGSTRKGTDKGLRYKDTVFMVCWKDNKPELRWSLKREFAKGMHDKKLQRPTHILYEHLPDQPLVVHPMLFMLAIFIGARALKGYQTVEEVLSVEPPSNERYWVFEWEDRVLELPVFPTVTTNGPQHKIQTASAFSKQLKELSFRAGMEQPPTIHSGRRESLIQATASGYSKDELMKFAAHTNQMTLTRDYLSSISSVDGLGSFLKLSLRSDQAEDFRSMTVKRNPELFTSLPAKAQDELRRRQDYLTIKCELEGIAKTLKSISLEAGSAENRTSIGELLSRRTQLHAQKRMLEKTELDNVRRTQERIHPSKLVETVSIDHNNRSVFERLRHMMPERDRLSNTLFCVAPLRSPKGISAVKDLIALLENCCQVAYQPGLRPIQGKCPVPECGKAIEQQAPELRWKHVFNCFLAFHKGNHDFVEFCFLCNEPVAGRKGWEIHCQKHIDSLDLPLYCDFVEFRRAIVCPGRCLICIHSEQMPASRRLYGFMKRESWLKHINDCFEIYTEAVRERESEFFRCPDSGCSNRYQSDQELWYHLQDAHNYPSRQPRTKRNRQMDIFIGPEDGRSAKRRQHAKKSRIGKTDMALPETKKANHKIESTSEATLGIREAKLSYTETPSSSLTSVASTSYEKCRSEMLSNLPPQIVVPKRTGHNQAFTISNGSNESSAPILPRVASETAIEPAAAEDQPVGPEVELRENSILGMSKSDDKDTTERPRALDEEEGVWEVEEVLAKRKQGRKWKYLLKWMGFPDTDNTWEDRGNINDVLTVSFDAAYREQGGNHSGVELLDKRNINGKPEYLVRWRGRPDTENSWEKKATISQKRRCGFEAHRSEAKKEG